MKLLLDTNAVLAVPGDGGTIRARVESMLNDETNEKLVSVASFWEMAIKVALGKLHMAQPPEVVMGQFEQQGIATILPIRSEHLHRPRELPHHHRDPFDRLIVAQALSEGCSVISRDGRLEDYGVKLVW